MRNGTSKFKKIVPYLYITPISLILFVFVIGSVVISIVLGFTKYNIIVEPVFQGMENYRRLMEDVKFMKAVKNTFKLAIMIVPFQVMISLLASIIIHANRKRFLGKLANMIVFIPVLCSNAVVGVVWRELKWKSSGCRMVFWPLWNGSCNVFGKCKNGIDCCSDGCSMENGGILCGYIFIWIIKHS